MTFDEAAELAVREYQAGNKPRAEAICREVLTQCADHPIALQVMGVLAIEAGQIAIAISLLESVVRQLPQYTGALRDLGRAYEAAGNWKAGINTYEAVLALEPQDAGTRNQLGLCLFAVREYERAIEQYRMVMDQGVTAPEVPNNIANALQAMGRVEESEQWYRKALDIRPDYAEAYSNWASALRDMKRLEEAIPLFDKAIALRPDYASAHRNRALTLLTMGRLQEGWEEWEWRWKAKGFNTPVRFNDRPRWQGEDLSGKTILLHHEQGAGDSFQFARYVPMVVARAKPQTVIVETLAEAVPVIQTVEGVTRAIAMNEPVGEFDVQCSLATVARVFGTTMQTIPARVPYVRAREDRLAMWEQRLGPSVGKLRVGLVWSGNPAHGENTRRRTTLAELSRLADVEGVRFYSLQKGEPAKELATAPAGFEITDLGPELRDFGDTAAVLRILDLLITCDTSVPHLAGALGVRTWTMLAYVPDWRWFLEREDSPWYPTMRLFRQKTRGDWGPVIEQIRQELAKVTRE